MTSIFTKIATLQGSSCMTEEEMLSVVVETFKYLSGVSTSKKLKKTMLSIVDAFTFSSFKDWLDSCSYTLDALKRAIIYVCKKPDAKRSTLRRRFSIQSMDVDLVRLSVGYFDQKSLRVLRKCSHDKNPLVDEVVKSKQLLNYCKSLAFRKLRFIANNDVALYDGGKSKLEPLINDLMKEAQRSALKYAKFTDYTQLMNYVKRCVHNFAMRIIDYSTAKKRARITPTDGEREFSVTLTSLDDKSSVNDAMRFETEPSIHARLELKALKEDAALGPLVRAALGEDPRFESFLYEKNINRSLLNEYELVSLARKYLQLK